MAKQTAVEFNRIKPKTKNQCSLVKAIDNNDIIFCEGISGTGKTYLALNIACDYLLSGKVDRVLISRTIVPCGDLGYLPGSATEKAAPYFSVHLYYLEKLLGKNYKQYIGQNKIIFKPVELMRGDNFENTFIVADEVQNFDIGQIKVLLTRLGQGSKCVCCGDLSQRDVNSGAFRFVLNYLNNIDRISMVYFDESDILRNDIIGKIIKVFNNNGY